MRQVGLIGCHRRRAFQTTPRDPVAQPAPDLLQRTVTARAPDQLGVADIT
jgi:putative transposase